MITRKTPSTIPEKPHYVTLEIEGIGETNWRIPSMVKAVRIISYMQTSGVMDAAAAAENGDQIVANMGEHLPALFSCQGALLGVCWADIKHDLETALPLADASTKGLAEFGEAVYEELWESGLWKSGQVQEVFVALTQHLMSSFITQKEVTEKVDFLAPKRGKPN